MNTAVLNRDPIRLDPGVAKISLRHLTPAEVDDVVGAVHYHNYRTVVPDDWNHAWLWWLGEHCKKEVVRVADMYEWQGNNHVLIQSGVTMQVLQEIRQPHWMHSNT